MRHFGVVGNPLGHSFSAAYFAEKFRREGIDADYRLLPLPDIQDVVGVMEKLDGFNVTLPYKQAVMPYLSELDSIAETIGAVNVVRGRCGYNTDWVGFVESIRPLLSETDKRALVLGTGGVSKAVQYGLKRLGVEYMVVSRSPHDGAIAYEDIGTEVLAEHTVVVNCTPLGMYPDVDKCPCLPYEQLDSRHLLYDCVYNPERTLFLQHGEERGARTKNGLEMLHLQAEAAWKIWNEQKTDNRYDEKK